jgi:hypothetical protein
MRRAFAVAALVTLVAWPARSGADGPDEERPLDGAPIPTEKSGSPKSPEWGTALRVRPTRRGTAAAVCKADLVREWLRVKCASETFAVSMLGGDLDGSAFWIDPLTKDGEVMMPLRRGNKHVFQFWKPGKDAAGAFSPVPTFVVQEYWLDDGSPPVLTVL